MNLQSAIITTGGTLEAAGSTLFADAGTVVTGAVMITGGGLADFADVFDQNVTFTGAGTLELAHSSSYGATVSGFASGDKIDLTDLAYASNETAVWTQANGTLQIYSGVTLEETLHLAGTYSSADFLVTRDSGAGTEVVTSGTIIIENGQTIEVAGASSALTASYIGTGGTLTTDAAVTGGASAGISATSTDGAPMTINAGAGVTSTGVDAIDATNSGGAGDLSITANGTTNGAFNGISATQNGSGNVSVTTGPDAIISTPSGGEQGNRALTYGGGSIFVTTGANSQINTGSSGIYALNLASSASPSSTITVNAYGAINPGAQPNQISNTRPTGILAFYNGGPDPNVSPPNANVLGDVLINNYADITTLATATNGDGIRAGNYGAGNTTINDEAGTTISATHFGIDAISGYTGNIAVTVDAGASITAGNSAITTSQTGTVSGDTTIDVKSLATVKSTGGNAINAVTSRQR